MNCPLLLVKTAMFGMAVLSFGRELSPGIYSRVSREDTVGWFGFGVGFGFGFFDCACKEDWGGDGGSNILSSGNGLKKSLIRPFLLFLFHLTVIFLLYK